MVTRKASELGLTPRGGKDPLISGIAIDSRQIREGFLFAALPGSLMHGAEFIGPAVRMGASVILTDAAGAALGQEHLSETGPALVIAEDAREVFARSAALWFGAQPSCMVAVTGTNGKTSVASFTRQIWEILGLKAINIGTTGVEGALSLPSSHTTPDPITLHQMLAKAAAEGVTHAAMEASSHGLDQRRMDGVRLVAAGFTNLTQDHLDYHKTMEAYFEAKSQVFTRVLSEDGIAVINTDGAMGPEMAALARARGLGVMTVGRGEEADLRLISQRFQSGGQEVRFGYRGRVAQVHLNLVGGFQAENVAVAAGLCIAGGAEPVDVFAALPLLQGVRGRMQLAAKRRNGAAVYVDYAHTPDAIETALRALRPHVMGKIAIVFGAGGDRDRSKRPLMGMAAKANADVLFVTDDNPRGEDPAAIRAAIMAACPEANEIGDRAEAILMGVDCLGAGDALLVAGKGHETGQTIAGQVFPFDDLEQASISVAALDGLA